MRDTSHVGDFVPDLIVPEPLQIPGCAVGDRSVLADVDRAPRGAAVVAAELGKGEEDQNF